VRGLVEVRKEAPGCARSGTGVAGRGSSFGMLGMRGRWMEWEM
jgi:hypothetical protein